MDPRECKVHKLVADVLIRAEGRVLLVRYKDVRRYDGQEGWFLPDDYLAYGEHPREAARRILQEQVGLETGDIALGTIESFGGDDGGAWHLVFHHRVDLAKSPAVTPGANVKAAEWFSLDGLPERAEVAHHGWAIDVIQEVLGPRE